MPSLSLRALPPVVLVIGLVPGCGGSTRPPQESPPRATPTVTSEDIERQGNRPIEEVLMGRFPGVMVERTPDGGIAVRIRGVSTFMSGQEPLYVIDGMPLQPGPNGSLSGINPHDIATIQVLKDPADTAIYGMRGANGVIVIKTKRPGH